MNRLKTTFTLLLAIIWLLSACGPVDFEDPDTAGLVTTSLPSSTSLPTATQLPTETPVPTSTPTPLPTETPVPVEIRPHALFASELVDLPLWTQDRYLVPVQDLLAESEIWRIKYLVATNAGGDQIPIPLDAVEITRLEHPDRNESSLVLRTDVNADVIARGPSFRSEDIERLRGVNPQALELLGISEWDELARDYWEDHASLQQGEEPEAQNGLPFLLTGRLVGGDDGISFRTVTPQGDVVGSMLDFITTPDGQIRYAVIAVAETGRRHPVPLRYVSLDIQSEQFVVPFDGPSLAVTPGYAEREEFLDFAAENWEQPLQDYWITVGE